MQIRFCYGVIPAWIINPLILLRIGNSFRSSVMQLLPICGILACALRDSIHSEFLPIAANPLNGQGPCPADKKAPAGVIRSRGANFHFYGIKNRKYSRFYCR